MSVLASSGMPVIGYVRVSTSEQAESGLGLAAQESAIRSHCSRQAWQLIGIVHDDGASAKDLDRPGLSSALQRIADGEAVGLVAAKLDRLSRSVVDFANLMRWCDDARCALVALDMGVDTSTPAGRLVANVMSAVAEWERETISQRTRDAAAVRRSQGANMGRPGVRDSRPDLADRIQAERTAGSTWQAIADRLNAEGIPTVRGGLQWRVSSVQSAAGYVRPPSVKKASDLPALPRRRRARSLRAA
jgi:DNA invertase Pin-like site-specific DNA recombinase